MASQVRPLTTAVEGTDGRIWFTLRQGVVWLDPRAYSQRLTVPPPIAIQSISADGKDYPTAGPLSLPAGTSNIEIEYSAVSLSDPEAIRFRYKLDEIDKDWRDISIASPVTYTRLPPGRYHFNVGASDTNGVWSDKLATAEFTILPAFYQTLWFRSLCVILLLVLVAGLYRLRLKQLARQFTIRLEGRLSERTRIARELHDTMLQSFQASLMRFQTVSLLLSTRPQEAREKLGDAICLAAQAITEGRAAVQGLRSPSSVATDLPDAINALGKELAMNRDNTNHVSFHVDVVGTSRNLQPLLRDEVYRIAGEALRNAFEHSKANRIEVEIQYDDRNLRLRIRDDGDGFDPDILAAAGRPGHFGLPVMRERAKIIGGQLDVWSTPESGTEIELSIPASKAYVRLSQVRSSWLTDKLSGKTRTYEH